MNKSDLIKLLKNEGYKFKYWSKNNKNRLYFNFRNNVTSYIDLELKNESVIACEVKCFYEGAFVSKKWTKNYLKPYHEHLSEVAELIYGNN